MGHSFERFGCYPWLDDEITPGKYLFVRNNGRPPETTNIEPDAWELEIGVKSSLPAAQIGHSSGGASPSWT